MLAENNNKNVVLEKDIDISGMETRIRDYWDRIRAYDYNTLNDKPIFSVDTPPPYVSASHLHVGHAMSYTQAEIIVRYRRMKGFNVFYPMGFDDNGLPTERFVEQTYKIDKSKISRSDFRSLCISETDKGAKEYEKLWRALGLSVDWSLRYSTIDIRSRHTSQKSFIDLYNRGLIYRANEPVLWDTHFETSLAQADLETITRKGKMYDIQFQAVENSEDLRISTTRPELLPACVALFVHPTDERYTKIVNRKARVPLFNQEVPILTSEDVDPSFGTGLMMVCTFGDAEDVKKWKDHNLETRIVLLPNGKLNDLAGPYANLNIENARKLIVQDLAAKNLIIEERAVEQNVTVGERSETPVEFIMTPQWFVNILEHKDRFLERAKELQWFPEHMKVRLEQWISGLKYDWNISRQRFYGVQFPLWHVVETGDVILADEKDLPVDPTQDLPSAWALEKYKGLTIVPEYDVMDTWMTSSQTPLINSNWVQMDGCKAGSEVYPMSLRVQAFEIIRTWLFYTIVKSEYHTNMLPWKDVMISGWGLNEQGKKISKRDLEKYTDAAGYNRYNPYSLIERYGADAVRSWASHSGLGQDLKFNEKDIKDGRKIVVKLWNVARMTFLYTAGYNPKNDCIPFAERNLEDQWIKFELDKVASRMTAVLDKYDYATARENINKFFWTAFCDDYLEIIKGRFWSDLAWTDKDRLSAKATLYETLNTILKLYAPYLPFITEEIYQRANKFEENSMSLHLSEWPRVENFPEFTGHEEMKLIRDVLYAVRKLRSEMKVGGGSVLDKVIININSIPSSLHSNIRKLELPLQSATRAINILFELGEAVDPTENTIQVKIVPLSQDNTKKMNTMIKFD